MFIFCIVKGLRSFCERDCACVLRCARRGDGLVDGAWGASRGFGTALDSGKGSVLCTAGWGLDGIWGRSASARALAQSTEPPCRAQALHWLMDYVGFCNHA